MERSADGGMTMTFSLRSMMIEIDNGVPRVKPFGSDLSKVDLQEILRPFGFIALRRCRRCRYRRPSRRRAAAITFPVNSPALLMSATTGMPTAMPSSSSCVIFAAAVSLLVSAMMQTGS